MNHLTEVLKIDINNRPIDKQFALICDIKEDANEIRYNDLKKFVNENKCDNNDELKK